MRYMGIDYGDKRIGVAVSDPLNITAQGVATIENTGGKKVFQKLAELIGQYGVTTVVIGLPKNMNNTLGDRVERTRAFASRLAESVDATIDFADERLTTVEAHGYLSEMNVRGAKRKAVVDTVSAVLILETYLRRKQA